MPSLNLGQAVLLAAYEYARKVGAGQGFSSRIETAEPATRDDMEGVHQHLEQALDQAGFFFPAEKTQGMKRNLRAMFAKADFTKAQVHTFRGVIKVLSTRRK